MSDRPWLQLALDVLDLKTAIAVTEQAFPAIDVIEVGTLLCLSEGMQAVRTMRKMFETTTIAADVRIVRAGAKIAEMAFDAGANWVTVVGEAPLGTLEAALKVAHVRGGEIQVELHNGWTHQDFVRWRDMGVRHVILHNGVEVDPLGGEWSKRAIDAIHELSEKGFCVTATGGITLGAMSDFRGVPISIFIIGRSIVGAECPLTAAKEYRAAIEAAHV